MGGQRDAVPPPYSEDIPLRLAMRPARSRCAFVRRNCLIFPECTASESDGGDSEEEGTVAEGASAECEGKPRPKSQAAKEILYANTSSSSARIRVVVALSLTRAVERVVVAWVEGLVVLPNVALGNLPQAIGASLCGVNH